MGLTVTFFPSGKKTEVKRRTILLDAAEKAGVRIQSPCGYAGACGKCKVSVINKGRQDGDGAIRALTSVTEEEMALLSDKERREGMRLACCAKVLDDVEIFVPPESRVGTPLILDKVRGRQMALKPSVVPYYIEMPPPTLEDHRDDFSRIKDALAVTAPQLKNVKIDYGVARELSPVLRKAGWKVTLLILYDNEIIGVRAGLIKEIYGIAVDIGTTTVAAYMCSLNTGKIERSASTLNQQAAYGADILSRISYCMLNEDGLAILNKALCDTVNGLIGEMSARTGVHAHDIVEIVLVFNTVMQHIALNIRPDALGVSPFVSSFQESVDIKARDIGFDIMPGANVHCLPSIGGFIGADCTAALLSEEIYSQDKNLLLIDIGTNSEICLGNKKAVYSTSCATGPALEGAQISCGMRAENGAVQHVSIDPLTLEPRLDVIGDEIPRGICGSGIIDVIARLNAAGVITSEGKFSKGIVSPRLRLEEKGKSYEYVLYFARDGTEKDITVNQKDIRAVQLAKAALYSGAKTLMQKSGIDEIEGVILAGAFGNYIDKANAVALGMFPDCHLDRVRVVGNAAGEGARLALINTDKREEAYQVAKSVIFVENAADEGFYKLFGEAIAIPHGTDLFLANLPDGFPCGGLDQRNVPEEVRALGQSPYTDKQTMLWSARRMAKIEKQSFIRLPLNQSVEIQAYGAKTEWKDGLPLSSGYLYSRVSQLRLLTRDAFSSQEVRNVMNCIEEASGEKIMLDVAGPFSVLSGLIELTRLVRGALSEPDTVNEALDTVVNFLVRYVSEALDKGVRVISLADPVGTIELMGEPMYKKFCGAALHSLLTRLAPRLENSVIHLCGKTSASLRKGGFIAMKPKRIPAEMDYREVLFSLAEDKNLLFAGNNCVNVAVAGVPILWQAELRGALKKREEFPPRKK